jgi:hypothetical protein
MLYDICRKSMVGFVCYPLSLEIFLMMHFIVSRKEVMLEHFLKCCLHVLLEINKLKNLRFTFPNVCLAFMMVCTTLVLGRCFTLVPLVDILGLVIDFCLYNISS